METATWLVIASKFACRITPRFGGINQTGRPHGRPVCFCLYRLRNNFPHVCIAVEESSRFDARMFASWKSGALAPRKTSRNQSGLQPAWSLSFNAISRTRGRILALLRPHVWVAVEESSRFNARMFALPWKNSHASTPACLGCRGRILTLQHSNACIAVEESYPSTLECLGYRGRAALQRRVRHLEINLGFSPGGRFFQCVFTKPIELQFHSAFLLRHSESPGPTAPPPGSPSHPQSASDTFPYSRPCSSRSFPHPHRLSSAPPEKDRPACPPR